MIKKTQRTLNRIHVLIDAIIVVISYLLAILVQFVFQENKFDAISFQEYLYVLLVLVPAVLLLNGFFHLYQPKRVMGRRLEASNVFKTNILVFLLIFTVSYIVKEMDFSRGVVTYFVIFNTILTIAWRNGIRLLLRSIRRSGFNQKHILLVGYSRAAEGFIDRVNSHPQWGYHIAGILDDNQKVGDHYRSVSVLGNVSELEEYLAQNTLDEIVITLSLSEYEHLEAIVNCCEKSGVHTKFVPDYNNVIPSRPYTEDLLGLPVVNIRHVPLQDGFNRIVKRTMDVVISIMAIVVFSPILVIAALAVKLSSKGDLIYKQERVGLHNRPFYMYKFRSMEVQPVQEEAKKWTTPNDPRVTSVGKFIRKTSIDELPQLFNVLKGDMSLVGPRPERPFFVEKFKEEIPRYMVKHQVRPGMTGWAQVNGYRGDTSIRKRIEHDLYYIENWTFGLDIKILFLTVFRGFVNKNAY